MRDGVRRAVLCGVLICGCGGARSPSGAAEATARTGRVAPIPGADVTAQWRQANGASRFGSPTAPSRRGTVRPLAAEATRIRRTDYGFLAQFPSNAPVATPTAHRGVVVVSGGFRSHEVFAFRAGRPEIEWAITVDDDGPSIAACEDGVCVFNTESCTIYGVQAETGELLWSWWLGDPLMSAPTIANGRVFTAYPAAPDDGERPEGASHAFAAFDLHTGELRWSRWIDSDVITAPMAVDDEVYAATFAGTVVRFDQRTGRIESANDARATSAPALIDGALYFSRRVDEAGEPARETLTRSTRSKQAREMGTRDAADLTYDFQDDTAHGELSQSYDAANGFHVAPEAANMIRARQLIGRSTVSGLQEYQGSWVLGVGPNNYSSMGDAVVSFDRWSGNERWRVDLPGDLSEVGGALGAPPASAGPAVVVAATAGHMLVIDAEDGRVTEQYPVGQPLRTQPIVHEGWIYAGTATGGFVAIDTRRPELTGWPTWAGNAARTGAPTRDGDAPHHSHH